MRSHLYRSARVGQRLCLTLLALAISGLFVVAQASQSAAVHKPVAVKKKPADARHVAQKGATKKAASKQIKQAKQAKRVGKTRQAIASTASQRSNVQREVVRPPHQHTPAQRAVATEQAFVVTPVQRPTQAGNLHSELALSSLGWMHASPVAPDRTESVESILPPPEQPSLSARVALVVDQETNEVLFSKNESAILPIASITKLMTGLVIADAGLPFDEVITITHDDVDTRRGSRSRLPVGTRLTRGELMHLSLMSSENRAAHALGRTYPGGMNRFVTKMNIKARELGMSDTRFVEPTGLLSQNRSSARDLATLVSAAYQQRVLRDLSTSPGHQLALGRRTLHYSNSNLLVHRPEWEIGLQKTGYIAEAGRCLVMQANVAGRKIIMVFLNAADKIHRLQDAESMRRWVELQTIHTYFADPKG